MSPLLDYRQFLISLLEPPKKQSVVDWCETNVNLPTGAIKGRVSLHMAPYGREILERFGDKRTKDLVMCFSTQSSKTTLIILGMLYRLCNDPQDTMWVMPNADLAKSFNKARHMKFIEECPPALSLVPRTVTGEIDRHRYSFMEQHFTTQYLKFVGSNSPANLSSFPCGVIVMDETDKYGEQTKFEAAALDTAQERLKTFPFPLCIKASTPTVAGRMIWPEFLKTDQRYFWLPCPRCGKFILLRFTAKSETHGDCGLRWWRESPDEAKTDGAWDMHKIARNAFYRCQECGDEIQSEERHSMLEAGIWRPANTMAEEGVHGYHLNSLYSILSQKTNFANIAINWLQSKGILSARQNFINSWLAETWDAERMFDQQDIALEPYSLQDVSEDSTAIMFADVQENHFWVVVRRFAAPSPAKPNGESWLLYADRVETEDELDQIQKDNKVVAENVLLDMAHRPNQVGRLIIEHNWRGMWGTDTKSFAHIQPNHTRIERIYSTVLLRDPHLGTAWENRTIQRARYFKYSKGAALDIVSSLRYATPTIWHITANASDRYQRHLNSKMKIMLQNKRTGRWEAIWKDLHQEDHLLDGECGVAIRAIQLGLVSLPDEQIQMA
jgi:Phage terminase large subunit (GpA)